MFLKTWNGRYLTTKFDNVDPIINRSFQICLSSTSVHMSNFIINFKNNLLKFPKKNETT